MCKQSETNEADFSDLLQTRNDEIVVLRNDEPDRWRHVDVGIGTDQAEDDEYIEAEEEAEDEGEEAEEAEEEEEKIKQEKKQNVVHCHKELKEIPAPKSFGNLTVDNDQFELNSNHNSFVQMLRNQKNNRRRSSDDTAFQGKKRSSHFVVLMQRELMRVNFPIKGLYHGSTGAKNVARPQRGLLRKSKTSVDARDFQIKKHRHRSDFEKSDQKERRRLHSLIKVR